MLNKPTFCVSPKVIGNLLKTTDIHDPVMFGKTKKRKKNAHKHEWI